MLQTKGFRFTIGKGKEFLVIENVDKSNHVSFIEHDGTTYDLTEDDFILLAERFQKEAEKIKKAKNKREPKVSIDFGEEQKPIQKKGK